MITKALIHDPELLILDEPDTAIDAAVLKLFYKLLTKLNKERKITIIWSSHDLDAVSLLSNKVACLYRKLFFHGISEDFFNNENNLKTFAESSMHIHIKSHSHWIFHFCSFIFYFGYLCKNRNNKCGLSVFWFEYFIKSYSQFIPPWFFHPTMEFTPIVTQNNENNDEKSSSFLQARFPEYVKKAPWRIINILYV